MKGIRFGAFHSYDDLKLILSRKELGAPAVKSNKLDIPGADSSLDLTDYFGEPKYEDVTHRLDFSTIVPQDQFITLYSRIKNAIHGRKMRIILDDDPLFFWVGRCHVSKFTNEKGIGTIEVECDCEPYKYKTEHTVISQVVSGTQEIILVNGRKRAVPEVQVYTQTGSIRIVYHGFIWDLSSGSYTLPELELTHGENPVTVSGDGTITFAWLEGDL
jgi:phage-related protein